MIRALLGIDLGTTGARAVLVDAESGRVVGAASSEYPLATPRPLWAEQHPQDWWRGAVAATRAALAQAKPVEVSAIGLSGQMHGVVLLDEADAVLAPAILWCDGRTQAECDAITNTIGAARLIELTANPALVGFSAPKLLWLRAHAQEAWARARRFVLPKDFLRQRLTCEHATDVSDASGTLLFDVARRRWSSEVVAALGLDPSLLPAAYESTALTGRLTPRAADELGLPSALPVVAGGGDQAAGAVGTGVVRPGVVSATIGSSGVVFAHAATPVREPGGRAHTFCHAVPGAWHVMGVTQGAGLSLRWLRDQLGSDSYEPLIAEAARVPIGCEGLLFLPYLMGERTPHLDPLARGVYCGLTAAHGRGHLVRAVMEGVAYSLRDGADLIAAMGLPVVQIRASGGGSRSALWRQIQADVFGSEVVTVHADEGPGYGAALLSGVGVGAFRSVEEACDACVRLATRVEPDPAAQTLHAERLLLYRELYARLQPLFPRL